MAEPAGHRVEPMVTRGMIVAGTDAVRLAEGVGQTAKVAVELVKLQAVLGKGRKG